MTESRGKYNARRTKIDGHTFHSKAEARRYSALMLLERSGQISDLELQPSFVIQDAFRDRSNKIICAIRYLADFQYVEKGALVVEDVKGVETAVFKIKAKMFKLRYPEYDFRVIPAEDVK